MGKLIRGVNDLATTNPELLDEWDWEKNTPLQPTDFVAGSHEKVYWKCSKCGEPWYTEIRVRAKRGHGCRKCGRKLMGDTFRRNLLAQGKKSLAEEHPEIAREWHPTKNQPKTASDYTSASGELIWWKCPTCGYEWPATIYNRVFNKSGCPLCAGSIIVSGVNDLQTKNPDMAAEWHPIKNLPLKPNEIASYSDENVWWVCKFGHEYRCRVSDRQKGVGCSECSKRFQTSLPERIVEYYVRKAFPACKSNYKPSCLNGAEIDIFIPELSIGIEYDGQRFHQNIIRDEIKDKMCHKNGIQLIRIREKKCPLYTRSDPTFIINDQSNRCFSEVIRSVLEAIGVVGVAVNIEHDKQLIIEEYWDTAIGGSIAELYPELAKEWHPTKNGELSPEAVSKGSSKKVWWKCSKCGHEWPTRISKRVAGSGCERCANIQRRQQLYKAVYQFSKEGEFIKEYPSARVAAEELGISRSSIQHVCTGVGGMKTTAGYRWSYRIDGETE